MGHGDEIRQWKSEKYQQQSKKLETPDTSYSHFRSLNVMLLPQRSALHSPTLFQLTALTPNTNYY